jgi:hypothetical protein
VSIYTRTNRTSDFTTAKAIHSYSATEDANKASQTRYTLSSSESRFQELEWGVVIGSTATSPEVYGISLKYEDLNSEQAI